MPKLLNIFSIIRRRDDLVEKVPEEFISAVERAQNSLADELINFLQGLKTEGGKIEHIPANIQMTFRMREQIRVWLRRQGYYAAVSDFGKQYDELLKAGREYYRFLDLPGSFTERDLETLSQVRKQDLDFLLNGDETIINSTYNAVTDAVYKEVTFRDLQKQLTALHTDKILPDGRELNGLLKRYSATYANTAFAAFDRKIQNIKSAELGLEHFLFSGGLIKDSRDFCKRRSGKVFTKKQVQSWEKMSWTGKAEGRSIWEYLGGWNCQHLLTPVTGEIAEELKSKK